MLIRRYTFCVLAGLVNAGCNQTGVTRTTRESRLSSDELQMLYEAREIAHETSGDINTLFSQSYDGEWIKASTLNDTTILKIDDQLYDHFTKNHRITELGIGYRGDAVVHLSVFNHRSGRITKFIPYYDMPFDYLYGEKVRKSDRDFVFFRNKNLKGLEFPLVINGKYICTLYFRNFDPAIVK